VQNVDASLLSGAWVLLVEDNPGDVRLIRETLRENGVAVHLHVASDGEQAIALIDRVDRQEVRCPDLILLDLNLPRKTGHEVLERLRKSPSNSASPVVILSSSSAPRDLEEASRLGATKYIIKPSTLEELMTLGTIVRDFLAQRSRQSESE
jgi:chemotaxis family two-component system response regulator Rcp1